MSTVFGAVRDPMEREHIAIFCDECVNLHRVSVAIYQLGLAA
jgi:hypothetical protein